MSLKKKAPNRLWVTGIQRAQCRKINKLLLALIAAQTRLGGVLPITPPMIADFQQVNVDLVGLLQIKS